MIIKKPYAFLIRNFRLIHLFLSALLIFIAYKSTLIYNFFNSYVKEGHYTYYPNLSNYFINYYSFIIIILIILFGVVLYVLLKWKDKKTLYYISLCIFYIILFLTFLYFFNTFKTIETNTLDIRVVRIDRDFLLLTTIPQYLFILVSIFRGIGFDIKKFNFRKDLEDLNINVQDNEEVELILAKDTYKYMRTIRRVLREIRYFMLENRFLFFVAVSVVSLIIFLAVFLNVKVYNKIYSEDNSFYADSLNMKVDASYLSSVGYDGKEISNKNYYIIVKINIKNNNEKYKKLDLEKYRLIVNSKNYFPVLTKENYFIDLGQNYVNTKILSGKDYSYLIVYEIPKDEKSKNYIFRVLNDNSILNGNIENNYIDVKINPKTFEEKVTMNNLKAEEIISLSDSTLLNSDIKINSYKLAKEFNENYKYCTSEKCYTGVANIKPEIVGNSDKYVLKIDTTYNIDTSLYINKYISSINDFMNYFSYIVYILNGSEKKAVTKIITSKYTAKNIAYLEVPEETKNASNIYLVVSIRNINYKIKLK